jgi:ATP-binding cassette, subfamily B, multidrug efflux pump
VAQRVASIRDADQIVVLDDGAVVGIGAHDELLATSPTYAEIVASQFSAEEIGPEVISAEAIGAARVSAEEVV